jgi:hypothetical protein
MHIAVAFSLLKLKKMLAAKPIMALQTHHERLNFIFVPA